MSQRNEADSGLEDPPRTQQIGRAGGASPANKGDERPAANAGAGGSADCTGGSLAPSGDGRPTAGSDGHAHGTGGGHVSGTTGKIEAVREKAHEKAQEEVTVRGRRLSRGDIFKFCGLVAFFLIVGLVCVLLWPYCAELFQPGGTERIMDSVRDAGPVGVLVLLGLQFLQIIVAFIPGEVVQIAAGMLYGPWLGALVILVGCVVSSAFIFALVHKLGAPFVQDMIPAKYLDRFRRFEASGKLNPVVFVLFLIPGLPKDVFTYLVPLTDMRMRTFLVLSNIGRIPGILISTYAADGLVDGRIVESAVIFAVAALIAVIGIVFRERIMGFLDRHSHRK